MNPKLVRWITFLLAYAALIGFVAIYSILLASDGGDPPQPQKYLASGLAGLVGGIVAAAFGQKLPKNPTGGRSRLAARFSASGHFLTPLDEGKAREFLAAAYAVVYFGMSVWSIVVWAADKATTPDVVDNLAAVSLGLIIAIVTAYFSEPR